MSPLPTCFPTFSCCDMLELRFCWLYICQVQVVLRLAVCQSWVRVSDGTNYLSVCVQEWSWLSGAALWRELIRDLGVEWDGLGARLPRESGPFLVFNGAFVPHSVSLSLSRINSPTGRSLSIGHSSLPTAKRRTVLPTALEVVPFLCKVFDFFGAFRKIAKITKSYYYLRSVWPSVPLSARPHGTTGRIFMKFGVWVFFENRSRKFKFY